MQTALLTAPKSNEPQESGSINDVLTKEQLEEAINLADQQDEETKMPSASDNEQSDFVERQMSNNEWEAPTAEQSATSGGGDGNQVKYIWPELSDANNCARSRSTTLSLFFS